MSRTGDALRMKPGVCSGLNSAERLVWNFVPENKDHRLSRSPLCPRHLRQCQAQSGHL